MSDFATQLSALCAKEAAAAKNDPDRMADMIERLATALGFTVAMAVKGDPAGIDQLMAGAEAHAHREAVEKAPLAALTRLVG